MTIDRIKDLYSAEPFRPFVLHLADGRQVPVHHREFMMAVPSGRTVVVCQPDDTCHFIDVSSVGKVALKRTANGTRRRRNA